MTPRSSLDLDAPNHMKRRTCARKCERACCSAVTYFPLAFVYGVTSWAAWVLANMALRADTRSVSTSTLSAFGILLYFMLNWCYTIAVFTPPGSPSASAAGYSSLPTHDRSSALSATSFTVKSTGGTRFCKKCQARKPDRAHHCSSCKQCVLKMDHHCPWLATCVGLRNYKSFLLFLTYTSVFCWVCVAATTKWLWKEVFSEAQYTESFMPVNYIMLSVISAIIGLVLTGFTAWHISMAVRGLTTIECLEKTRYLSPLRKTMRKEQLQREMNGVEEGEQGYGQQLAEIHANALPGVTRPEEGEAMLGSDDLELGTDRSRSGAYHRSYASHERAREQERYEEYLDEQDSEKLPNAFDLGWKRNLLHLFGDKPLLWGLPTASTIDDGWRWEPNPKWVEARDALRRDREQDAKARGQEGRPSYSDHQQYGNYTGERHYLSTMDGASDFPEQENHHQPWDNERPGSHMSLKTLRRKVSFDGDDHYEVSSDEDEEGGAEGVNGHFNGGADGAGKWP